MVNNYRRWLASAALLYSLLSFAALANAQPSAARGRLDPSDPAAEVPQMIFRSAFARYQLYADQPVGSWKEANELVNRIGGWRAYAREGQAGSTPAAGPAVSAPAGPPGLEPAAAGTGATRKVP